jgi:hypothetical protein
MHALYPFMPKEIYRALEMAYIKDKVRTKVSRKKFEKMINLYLDSRKN